MKRFIFIALALIISTVGLYAENYISDILHKENFNDIDKYLNCI